MRILYVLEHYYPYVGGAERLFTLLAESMAAQGHEVTVVTTRFRAGLSRREVLNGVRVVRVRCGNRFLFSWLGLPAVAKLARRADLIHTTTYNAALPAWLAGRIRSKKVIVTFHEHWGDLWFRLPFLSRPAAVAFAAFERLLLALPFHRYVAVSDFTRRALLLAGIAEDRVKRIYNGIDYEEFSDFQHRPPQRFTYLYFGRLGVSKGLDLLLPAVAVFNELHPDGHAVFVLPTRPRAMYRCIQRLIDHYGLRSRITILNELSWPELKDRIRRSSCVLIPSYSEGFCFAAAEAVAMGVPIISSGRGALAETVAGNYLVMERMDAASLVNSLKQARNGTYQYRTPIKFPLTDFVTEHEKLYAEVIGDL